MQGVGMRTPRRDVRLVTPEKRAEILKAPDPATWLDRIARKT